MYQNIYLLDNFHKTLIKPFLHFLIRNVILYGDFNVQHPLKSSGEQNEVNAQTRAPSRSFTGESYRLGTGHSRSQTQYYGTYFNPSTPGSSFTLQDFNIIKKFNGDLYLWSSERFNIFNKFTLALGAKETIKDYHIGFANNISLEIPLFHNKLETINGFDLRFIHNFRQNKEKREVFSTTNFFTLELVYNDNFALALIPYKNFVGLSFNYLAHDGIKKQVRDYAKTLNEKKLLNKKNLNYAAIQNSRISKTESLNTNQNVSEDLTSEPKGIPKLPRRKVKTVKATAALINQPFSYVQNQRLKLATNIVKQKNTAKLKVEQAKQILLEAIKNNSFFSINNSNNNNNKTNLSLLIDILCGIGILGLIGSMVCLSIPQLNISIGNPITWGFTILIAIVTRLIVNIENLSEKVVTNTATNIINENPLIQLDLILFGVLCILGSISLILNIWKQLGGNDDKNNDFSKYTNKPPTNGGFDPTSNLDLETPVSESNIESKGIKSNVSKPENIELKFRKPTVKARNLRSFMAKIGTDIKKMKFFK